MKTKSRIRRSRCVYDDSQKVRLTTALFALRFSSQSLYNRGLLESLSQSPNQAMYAYTNAVLHLLSNAHQGIRVLLATGTTALPRRR